MKLKSIGYFILIFNLIFIIGYGIYKLLMIILSPEINLVIRIPLTGIIVGVLILLIVLIKERINEKEN